MNIKKPIILIISCLIVSIIVGGTIDAYYTYPEQGGTGTDTLPTKGDILAGTTTGLYQVFNYGTDNDVLQTNSSTDTGLEWTSDVTLSNLTVSNSFLLQGTVGVGGINMNGENIALNGGYVSGDGDDEGVYVDNSGNVGIGTTSPDAKLDVLGTTTQMRLTYADNTVYADMSVNSDGDLYITPTGGETAFGAGEAGDSVLDFYASSNRIWTVGLDDSDSDKFKISTSFDFSTGEQMSISTNGQVSFGDGLAGDSVIDLYAETTRTWTFGLDDSDSDSFKISTSSDFASGNALTILTGGNVGIGTTGPDALLDVLSTTTQLRLTYTDGSVYAGFRVDSNGDLSIDASGGDINLNSDLTFTGEGAGLPYGEIYVYNNSTADSIASGSYVQMTRFSTNGLSNNTTPDHTNDHITILRAGKYLTNLSCSFSGDGSVEWTGGVFKNNGATQLTNLQTSRKLGASGDVGSISISGIANYSVNDTIEVWFKHEAGVSKNITVKHCTLSVNQIGN